MVQDDNSFRLERQLSSWSEGVRYEIDFWRSWFSTRGLSWPDDYRERFDPKAALEPGISTLVSDLGIRRVRILDVGAGPATNVGKTHSSAEVSLSACDPLAWQYQQMYREFDAVPPVPTQFAVAEDLSQFFELSSYDIVHCRNALDHSFDPMRGVVEMLKVARVGGWVVLRHHPNEAEREDYVGFHQFNFEIRDGRFVIWNRETEYEPARMMPIATEYIIDGTGDAVVYIRKLGEFPRTGLANEASTRLKLLYGGLVGLFASKDAEAALDQAVPPEDPAQDLVSPAAADPCATQE